jgi:DNA-binding response OmpR family regulator
MRILLVEDDESIIQVLTATLTQQHYIVDVATDGESGWELVETYPYNLVLLDVMLPKLDGLSFCQRLRSRRSAVLVMLLTARNTSADKLAGLDSGADDYVVKPFNPQELAARIRALLRRGSTAPSSVLTCGNLRLDPETRDVTYNGQLLPLSRKEYLLLELFLRSQQQVFSRAAIVDRLWSYGEDPPMEDTIKSHIKSLRRKLEAVGAENLVETRYGQGYRINPAYLAAAEESLPRLTPPTLEPSGAVQSGAVPPGASQKVEAAVTRIWEQTKEVTLTQLAILEQTVTALRSATLDQTLYASALQSAHKLAGSLGMFGFETGSQQARQLEALLEAAQPLTTLEQQALSQQIQPLVQAIGSALVISSATPAPLLLVIDPDPVLIREIATAAQQQGIRVATAPTLALGRAQIQQECPSILLLDLALLTTTQRIGTPRSPLAELNCPPTVPLLLLSARHDWVARRTAIEAGGQLFLLKPTTATQVVAGAKHLLQKAVPTTPQILIVGDDQAILTAMQTVLEPIGIGWTGLTTATQFWTSLNSIQPDLLILDTNLVPFSALELCQAVRQDLHWYWLPIVVLAQPRDDSTVQQGFAAGADDVVAKSNLLPELPLRVLNRLQRTRSRRPPAPSPTASESAF